jgi:hypothetical protein
MRGKQPEVYASFLPPSYRNDSIAACWRKIAWLLKKGTGALTMKLQVKKLEQEVSGWQQVSVHPHRFGGMEFRFGDAEVGHVHTAC